MVDDLRQKQLVSEAACRMFEKCFTRVPFMVMHCTQKQTSEGDEPARPSSEKYSAILRMFALTLQFYSKEVYNYARETSDCLAAPVRNNKVIQLGKCGTSF